MIFATLLLGALVQDVSAAGPPATGPDLTGTYRTSPDCADLVMPAVSTRGDDRPDWEWFDLDHDWIAGPVTIEVSFPDRHRASLTWSTPGDDWLRQIESRKGTHELRSSCYFLCTQFKAKVDVDRGRRVSIKRKGRTFVFWGTVLDWKIERHGDSGAIIRWEVDRDHLEKLEGSCRLERTDAGISKP